MSARTFKMTAFLDVSRSSVQQQESLIQHLDSAVYEVSPGYPTVTRYRVRREPESGLVSLSLRLERVEADRVDPISKSLVSAALEAVRDSGQVLSVPDEALEWQLVQA